MKILAKEFKNLNRDKPMTNKNLNKIRLQTSKYKRNGSQSKKESMK